MARGASQLQACQLVARIKMPAQNPGRGLADFAGTGVIIGLGQLIASASATNRPRIAWKADMGSAFRPFQCCSPAAVAAAE
jgi:hypothetical protein